MGDRKSWEPDEETKQIVAEYGELFNNTGGNDPIDMLRALNTNKRLMSVNIVVFVLATAVQSQIVLIKRLKKEGKL